MRGARTSTPSVGRSSLKEVMIVGDGLAALRAESGAGGPGHPVEDSLPQIKVSSNVLGRVKEWASDSKDAVKARRFISSLSNQHSLVEDNKVVLEKRAHDRASIFYQGDKTMYKPTALLQRFDLSADPDINAEIKNVWDQMPKVNGAMTKDIYMWQARKLYNAIVTETTNEILKHRRIEKDWIVDSRGNEVMDYINFKESFFGLIDIWCNTLERKEYIEMIRRCYWALFLDFDYLPGSDTRRPTSAQGKRPIGLGGDDFGLDGRVERARSRSFDALIDATQRAARKAGQQASDRLFNQSKEVKDWSGLVPIGLITSNFIASGNGGSVSLAAPAKTGAHDAGIDRVDHKRFTSIMGGYGVAVDARPKPAEATKSIKTLRFAAPLASLARPLPLASDAVPREHSPYDDVRNLYNKDLPNRNTQSRKPALRYDREDHILRKSQLPATVTLGFDPDARPNATHGAASHDTDRSAASSGTPRVTVSGGNAESAIGSASAGGSPVVRPVSPPLGGAKFPPRPYSPTSAVATELRNPIQPFKLNDPFECSLPSISHTSSNESEEEEIFHYTIKPKPIPVTIISHEEDTRRKAETQEHIQFTQFTGELLQRLKAGKKGGWPTSRRDVYRQDSQGDPPISEPYSEPEVSRGTGEEEAQQAEARAKRDRQRHQDQVLFEKALQELINSGVDMRPKKVNPNTGKRMRDGVWSATLRQSKFEASTVGRRKSEEKRPEYVSQPRHRDEHTKYSSTTYCSTPFLMLTKYEVPRNSPIERFTEFQFNEILHLLTQLAANIRECPIPDVSQDMIQQLAVSFSALPDTQVKRSAVQRLRELVKQEVPAGSSSPGDLQADEESRQASSRVGEDSSFSMRERSDSTLSELPAHFRDRRESGSMLLKSFKRPSIHVESPTDYEGLWENALQDTLPTAIGMSTDQPPPPEPQEPAVVVPPIAIAPCPETLQQASVNVRRPRVKSRMLHLTKSYLSKVQPKHQFPTTFPPTHRAYEKYLIW